MGLGADLSLMSFLKQGPIRRGVVNAVNPMMPISTSEIFNPMQTKTKRIGEPPKVESVKTPTDQKKIDELKKEVKRSSLGLPSDDQAGKRLSVTGIAPPGGRRSSIRRRSSIYLNPGQANQDVVPEKSILRRDSVMNNQPLNSLVPSNTTSLLSGLNPNLPGLGGTRDRSRSILMMSSAFDEESDETSPVRVVKPEFKSRIGIRVKRDSVENDGVVGFGNVDVSEIEEKDEVDKDDEEAAMMRARMSRRRSTVFAEQLTEELGFPEVKINKKEGPGRESKKRQSRFKTAENKLAMAASERRRSMAEQQLKNLTKEKEKLIFDTNELVKTFKQYQLERSNTMDATRQMIDSSRKIVTELDGRKYSLLVEKEQFMFSNATIREAKEHHGADIDNMEQCDADIDFQIGDYGKQLNESSSDIGQARAKYDEVFEHHSSTGASTIEQFVNFKANVVSRDQVVTNVVGKLTEFTTSFDSYDHDISKLKKAIVENEKMREAKPLLEQKVAGRETFRMNNIKKKRPDRINKRLDMSQAALFALHKKDLTRLRRFSRNKLVN